MLADQAGPNEDNGAYQDGLGSGYGGWPASNAFLQASDVMLSIGKRRHRMNLPVAPIAHEGFFAAQFLTPVISG